MMRPVCGLGIYLLIVFLGGALMAPWVWHLLQWLSNHSTFLQDFAKAPFHRVVHRCFLFIAVVGVLPLSRCLDTSDRDLSSRSTRSRRFASGFLFGLISLSLSTLFALAARAKSITPDLALSAQYLAGALATALVVALIEEFLFRKTLIQGLTLSCRFPAALIISSTIYALVHFFGRPASPNTIEWQSGLVVCREMLSGFGDFHVLIPGFVNLTLAGILLGLVFSRWGLAASIGIHAGWVFWIKVGNRLFPISPQHSSWIWGTEKIIDGWSTFVLLCLLVAAFFQWNRKVPG